VSAALLALLAGAAGALQVAVQSKLGVRVGLLPATLFSALVSCAIGLALVLAVSRSFVGVGRALHQSPVLWIGGAVSLLIVFSIAYGGPRIGTTATIGFYTAGTLVAAMVIDRVGFLGLQRYPITLTRIAGLLLLGAGAVLMLRH
jgi:bacterial/archaeal transporter family-2 protein